jgi:hypothetical protein
MRHAHLLELIASWLPCFVPVSLSLSVAHKRGSEQLFVLEEAGHRLRQRTPAGPGGRQAGARATAANAQAGESTAAVASSERLVLPVSQ